MKRLHLYILFTFLYCSTSIAQLLPVRNEQLWGYSNLKGQLTIDYQFHDANFFIEDIGRVRQNGLYGFINEKGNWVIKNIYINASDFSSGLSLVTDTNNNQYFINKKGEPTISLPKDIAFAEPFVNGFSKISKLYIKKRITFEEPRYHMGFMNSAGNIVVDPIYDDLSDFETNGLARFVMDKKMGLINNLGKIILKPSYLYIGNFCNGLAIFQKGDFYGYLNQSGKVSIKPRFKNGGDFGCGLAPIMLENLWGFIDTAGKIIIKPIYTYAETFSEGMAGIVISKSWGMINTKGEMVIRNIFQDYAPFSNGLAAIKLKGLWGYIDLSGNITISPQYIIVGSFINQVSLVEDDENAIYINTEGSPIFKYNIKNIKKQEKKREYYWNNIEMKYEKEANDYLQNKKTKKK